MRRKNTQKAVKRVHKSGKKFVSIDINDVFEELIDRNRELEKQIKLFIEFKLILEQMCSKLKSHLTEEELEKLNAFDVKFNDIFGQQLLTSDAKCEQKNEFISSNNVCEDIKNDAINGNNFNDNQLSTHNSEDIQIPSDSEKPFKCPHNECHKSFLTKSYVRIHFQNSHSIVKKEVKNKNGKVNQDSVKKPFVCDFIGCGLSYTMWASLHRHQQIHKSSQFVCHWKGCRYVTNVKDNYRKHFKRHTGKRYVCQGYDGCSKTYLTESDLRKHIILVHKTTVRALKCPFDGCRKTFKIDPQLKRHISMVHTFRERTSQCDVPGCQFRTYNKFLLSTHKSNAHSSERPFQCSIEGCRKTFKTIYAVKAHEIQSHTNERLFKCETEDCAKTYRTCNGLKRHFEMAHINPKIVCDWPGCEFVTNHREKMKRHKVVHSPDRNILCDWPECGKTFKLRKYLSEHMAMHRNDKRYGCLWPGCQYRCVTRSNMTKHEKIHYK